MIRELGEAIGGTVVESVGRAVGRAQEQRPLAADVLESDDAYLAVFDAPGVESGDTQVRFEDNTVFVRFDRFRDFHEGYEMRFPGRGLALDGSVTLPEDAMVDPSQASATLKTNGTLQVRIPKVAVEKTESEETDTVAVEDDSEGDDGDNDAEDAGHDADSETEDDEHDA